MLPKRRSLALVKQMFLFSLLFFLTVALNTTPCQAGAGDLDPTFGDGGLVLTSIEGPSGVSLALKNQSMVLQTDGKWCWYRHNPFSLQYRWNS